MRPLQFGITCNEQGRVQPGYVVFQPAGGTDCYLLGERGDFVHHWRLPGKGAYGQIRENGNLLTTHKQQKAVTLPASGGRLIELEPSGEVVWDHVDVFQHHDCCPTPNGNIVYLAWELIQTDEAKMIIGGLPESEHKDGGVYADVLREVDRNGKIVWEWRIAEHLPFEKYPLRSSSTRHEYAHANTCHVQHDGNILVSFRNLDLIILVNRQTNEIEWEMQDRSWGGQQDCQRLGNGNIILFANGSDQPTPEYSRILEIAPESKEIVWQYAGSPPSTFFSARVSGVQRLDNGNTFICEGMSGRLFEVTSAGEIVWEYISPFYNDVPPWGNSNQIFRARKYPKNDPRLQDLV